MLDHFQSFIVNKFFSELKVRKGLFFTFLFFLFLRNKTENYKLNFYNYYVHLKFEKSLRLLNIYFQQVNLLPLSIVDYTLPLFVNNIQFEKKEQQSIIDTKKLITIVITAYNEESLLGYAVQSLLLQTYRNIEIIFIDDASIDSTIEVFESACKKYSFTNYKVIMFKENKGPFITKNIGLQNAKGDYITFHDADDWAHPQRLEEQIKKFEDENIIASISQLIRIKKNGELFSKAIYPINRIAMVSLMFKREVFEKLGYFYTDKLGADTEYFQRIKQYYGDNRVDNIKKVLTFAAYRVNSRTTSPETGALEFGTNPKRTADWKSLEKRLEEMKEKKREYYVPFHCEVEYTIVHKNYPNKSNV